MLFNNIPSVIDVRYGFRKSHQFVSFNELFKNIGMFIHFNFTLIMWLIQIRKFHPNENMFLVFLVYLIIESTRRVQVFSTPFLYICSILWKFMEFVHVQEPCLERNIQETRLLSIMGLKLNNKHVKPSFLNRLVCYFLTN